MPRVTRLASSSRCFRPRVSRSTSSSIWPPALFPPPPKVSSFRLEIKSQPAFATTALPFFHFLRRRRCYSGHPFLQYNTCSVFKSEDVLTQVFAARAEALLKLQRHQEADEALMEAPAFAVDEAARFFGAPSVSYHLVVRAQVDMAAGRFEEVVSAAEKAVQLDPNHKETAALARRIRAAAAARSKGNSFFQVAKFKEACAAYQDGLQLDPHNSVLLCNRAACRSKLGRWQEAVEDCDEALDLRPSYGKARLRRADCNAKLGRWKESVQDYEVLLQESPGDEEVIKALWEARIQLMKDQQPRA